MTVCRGLPGFALAVLGASAAAATPPPTTPSATPASRTTPVDVELQADAGCTDVKGFFARLRARTDRVRLAQPGERALVIDVKVSRVGPKVHGELRFREAATESATRQVDGASCEEVVGVLSLTAALALERLNAENDAAADARAAAESEGRPSAGGAASTSRSATGASNDNPAAASGKTASGERPVDVVAAPDQQGLDSADRAGRRVVRVELGAEVGVTEVLTPLLAMGVGPLARLRYERQSVGLSVLYWSSRLTNAESSTELRSFGFALSACPWSWRSTRARFEPCVLGSAGHLRVSDSSVTNPRVAERSLWGVGALGRAELALSPWLGLELEGGFVVPLVERRFATEGPRRIVAETPWISPFAGLAAVVSP